MQYAVDNFATDNVRWKYEAYFDQLLDLWEDGFYSKRQHSYNRYGQIYDLEPADSDSFIRHDLPLVSCYCPTYGRAHCLEEAIECFLKQDYQGPKELVILNDYADQELVYDHPEVRIINVKERIKPLGRKFNETIKHCKGAILFCWDDDDIFLPNRISYSLKKMERGVFYTRSGFSEDSEEQYSLFHPTAVAHSTHAFRREVFDSVGGYPETDHVAVDQYFIQKVRDHLGGDYFQKTNNEDIFYIYRWGSIGSYHTSDCASETHNVSDQVEIKLARQKADGSIPTGVVNLSPKWKYNYDCVAKAFFKPKMNHIWMNPNFGEPWFSYPNLYTQFVNETPNGGTIVEVGSWKGKSTAYLGVEVINSGKDIRVYAVDTWLGSPNEDVHQNDPAVVSGTLFNMFVDNMAPINSQKKVVWPLRADSIEAAKEFEDGSVDCIFIDASHDYENVKKDITAWLPKVKPGGILAGHDWSWHGVSKAASELLSNLNVAEDCWIYRKSN
jgi:glycosyltransferase involved in cell wall biosynthesis